MTVGFGGLSSCAAILSIFEILLISAMYSVPLCSAMPFGEFSSVASAVGAGAGAPEGACAAGGAIGCDPGPPPGCASRDGVGCDGADGLTAGGWVCCCAEAGMAAAAKPPANAAINTVREHDRNSF